MGYASGCGIKMEITKQAVDPSGREQKKIELPAAPASMDRSSTILAGAS
jgi:hypothetical protein